MAFIDNLKHQLLLLKKNIEESQDETAAKEEQDTKYIESYSIDNEAVVIHPKRLIMPSSLATPEGYLSPPSSRQEGLLKVLDLSDPKVLDAICTKLQSCSLKEVQESCEEEVHKNRTVAIDSSAVIYMNDEEENNSRDSKTPIQSKIPSRSGNEAISSVQDIQMLIMKLLKLKETIEDE